MQVEQHPEIAAPAAKAASSIVVAAFATLIHPTPGFWPHDAGGWAAFLASVFAAVYTFFLLCDWWWRRVWRPALERLGYLRPRPKQLRFVDVDDDTPIP